MTGTDILKSPCKVNERSRVVYFFDGYVAADIISGTEEQQKAVLALVGQAQAAFKLLLGASGKGHEPSGDGSGRYSCDYCAVVAPNHADYCTLAKVLRDAGVMSEADGRGEG